MKDRNIADVLPHQIIKTNLRLAWVAALLAVALPAMGGVSLYWDVVGGTGSWDTTSMNWSTSSGGTANSVWADGDSATFATAMQYGVNLSAPQSAAVITFAAGLATVQGSSLSISTGVNVNAGVTGTIASTITGGGFTKSGAGELVLQGANTFSGALTVNQGTLTLDNFSAANNNTIVLSPASPVTLHSSQSTMAIANAISLQGTTSTAEIDADAGKTLLLTGAITGGHPLNFNGLGTVRLASSAPNSSLSAVLTVQSGTLQVASDGALGATINGAVVNAGATLDFDGGFWYQSTKTITLNGAAMDSTDGNNQFWGNTILSTNFGPSQVGAESGSSLEFVGPVTGGGLVKVGPGTVTLSSSGNSYAGTEVAVGTLYIADGSTAGSGLVTVDVGAVLADATTAGQPNPMPGGVAVSGTISPGNGLPATLLSGSQTWNGGGSYDWSMNNASGTPGGYPGYAQLLINGSLTISATSVNPFTIDLTTLDPNFPILGEAANFYGTQDYSWTILTATNGISGFDPSKFVINSQNFLNNMDNGGFILQQSGNNLVLQFVQKPAITSDLPSSQSAYRFGTVTFSVTATGDGTLSYQWYTNNGTGAQPITGATSSSLTVSDLTFAEGISYYVTVTDPWGYAATSTVDTLTVNPAPLTVTANNDTKTYGGTKTYGAGSPAFTASGLKDGNVIDSVTITATSTPNNGTAAADPVGAYTLTPSAATGAAFNASDYAINYVTGTLTVGQATPTIVWANPADISYGTALGSGQLDAVANGVIGNPVSAVTGTYSYTPAAGTVLTVGSSQALSVSFTSSDANYANVSGGASINVVKTTPTYAGLQSPSIVYGTTSVTLTGSLGGNGAYVPQGAGVKVKIEGLGEQWTQITDTTGDFSVTFSQAALSTLTVGNYTIKYWYPGNANFNEASDSTTSLTVTPEASSFTYGGTPFVYTYNSYAQGPSVTESGSGAAQSTIYVGTNTLGTPYKHVVAPTNAGVYYISNTVAADTDHAGTTNSQSFVIYQATNELSLTSSENPLVVGDTALFTALVQTNDGSGNFIQAGDAAGQMVFYVNTTPVATNAVVNGQATYSVFGLPVGTYEVTVAYTNDINYTNSVLAEALDEAVVAAPPVFTSLTPNQQITFGTASVTVSGTLGTNNVWPGEESLGGDPESVTVTIGGQSGTGLIGDDGSFTVTVPTGTIQASGTPYTIDYEYAGDTSYFNPASDLNTTLTVVQETPLIVWANPTAIPYGTPLDGTQLNAVAYDITNGVVAGAFSYTQGGGNASGAILPVGPSQTLTANFTPTDGTDYTISSTNVTIEVDQSTPVFTGLPTAITIGYGTPTATLSGTLAYNGVAPVGEEVHIKVGGTWRHAVVGSGGAFSIDFPTADLQVSGTAYPVTYSYNGDSNFTSASDDTTTTVTVTKATPVLTITGASSLTYGQQLNASTISGSAVNPNNSGMSVSGTFSFGSPTLVPDAGTAVQNVTFTPNHLRDYTTASGSVSVTVVQAPSTITYSGPQETPPYTYIYNSTAQGPSVGEIGSSAPVSANYVGTNMLGAPYADVVPPVQAGVYYISNTVAADTDYMGTTNSVVFEIAQVTNEITLATSSFESNSVYGDSVTFTATVQTNDVTGANPATAGDATGSVLFFDGPTQLGTGTLSGGQATLTTNGLVVGSHTITVTYAGDNNYSNNVMSQTVTQTVAPATPIFNVSDSTITYGDDSVTVSGTLEVTNDAVPPAPEFVTVTIDSLYSQTATVNPDGSFSAVVTLGLLGVGAAPYDINFEYDGDANFLSAGADTWLYVNPADPVITWNPAETTITYGTPLDGTILDATAAGVGLDSGDSPLAGTFTYHPSSGAIVGAGAHQRLEATFVPQDSTDYNTVYSHTHIDVQVDSALSVTVNSPLSFIYNSVAQGPASVTTAPHSRGQVTWVYQGTGTNFIGGNNTYSGTTVPTNAGTYTATATVAADRNNASATSIATPFTINQVTNEILLATSSTASNSVYSESVTFTATVQTNDVTGLNPATAGDAGGQMTFLVDATPVLTETVTNGVATYVTSALEASAGGHAITAVYAGDNNYSNSVTTGALTQTVQKATPVFNFPDSVSSISILYGTASVGLSGTLSTNGVYVPQHARVHVQIAEVDPLVQITDDTGDFSVNYPTATLGVSGSPYTIIYTYNGDRNFNAASGSTTVTVLPATPVIVWSTPADIIYGTPLDGTQLDAQAYDTNGDLVAGTYAYSPNTNAVLNVGGDQSLELTFTPNDLTDYTISSTNVTIGVDKATAAFTSLSTPTITYGAATATVSGVLGGNGVYVPEHAWVHVTIAGQDGVAKINDATGDFSITWDTSALTAINSPYTIGLSYGGDHNFTSATGSSTLTVGEATPTVTVNVGNYVYNGQAQGPNTVTTPSTGRVTWLYTGSGYAPSATPPTAVGSYTATATVAGDGNYVTQPSQPTPFSITEAPPTVTVNSGQSSYIYNSQPQGPVNVTTVPASSGAVTWSYQGVGTNFIGGNNTYTGTTPPTAAGTYTATATVAADPDGNVNQGVSSASAFVIAQATNEITVASSKNPSVYGDAVTFTATVKTNDVTGANPEQAGDAGGQMVFLVNGTPAATNAVVNGQATYETSALTVAGYAITAAYTGDNNYSNSVTTSALPQTVTPATPTLAVNNSPQTYTGSPIAATITPSVGGLVGNVKYNGSTVTPTVVGTYAVTADFAPSDSTDYSALTGAAAGNFVIQAATPVVTVTVGTYVYSGSPQGPTAVTTVPQSSSSPTFVYAGTDGTVYPASATPPTAVGSYLATATVAADANNNTSSSEPTAFSITPATPVVTVNSPYTFAYSGQPEGPDSVTTVPQSSSTPTFVYAGVLPTVYAASATPPTASGSYTVTATVAADANNNLATSAATPFSIGQVTPTLTINSATPILYSQPLSDSVINGSAVNPFTSATVAGAFTFANPGTVPTGTGLQAVTFTPNGSDQANYTTASGTVSVPVADPAILTQPAALTVYNGGTATFSVTAAGTGTLQYQWQQAGVNLPGQTASTLVLTNVPDSAQGNYTVTVTGANGTTNSAAVLLYVIHPPSIVQQPISQVVTQGSTVTFRVTVSGKIPFTYRWFQTVGQTTNAVTDWLPVTGNQYTLNNVTAANDGLYSVEVTNVDGSTVSAGALLTVIVPPSITSQPGSLTEMAGATAVFSVANTGSPATYQWYKNGTQLLTDGANIAGSQTTTLTVTNVLGADRGTYDVVIANLAATVTSGNATLTVVDPILTNYPVAVVANAGTPVTFTVGAYGTAPQYQWYKNGTAITGAQATTFTIGSVSDNDVASYTVTVTNVYGTTSAPPVSLTVIDPPVITGNPHSATVNAGQTASFTVNFTGTQPNIQWYAHGVALGSAHTASLGVTSDTLTVPNAQDANATDYEVTLWNQAGTNASTPVQLTVVDAPGITAGPVNVTTNAGATATFAVTPSGSAASYQWYFGTNVLSEGNKYAGANASTLNVSNLLGGDAGLYWVVLQNSAGVASNSATLTVIDPVITQQPMSVTNLPGTTVSFAVTMAGTTPMTYQWYQDGYILPGATNSTLVLNDIENNDEGEYTVTIANTYGTTNSAEAQLVMLSPLIVSEPTGVTVNQGQTAAFIVGVNGALPFTFQWRLNGTNIPNATANILTLTGVQGAQAGGYDVIVSNPDGTEYSTVATLTVIVPPAIVTGPQPQTVFAGQTATFTVSYSGSTSTYQWYTNGVALGGATGATLTLTHVTDANAGEYSVVLNNAAGSITGGPALLTVLDPPVITQQPSNNIVAVAGQATPVVIGVTATGTSVAYQWFFNHAAVSAATSSSYTLSSLSTNNTGAYFVVVTNLAGSVTSSVANLTVYSTSKATMAFTKPKSGSPSIVVDGVPGYTYVVEGSTDLSTWVPLYTNTSPYTYTDVNASSFNKRFYRTVPGN